jgi:coproporphyrinogen III oxidase-like Fe-S oxidoreductase
MRYRGGMIAYDFPLWRPPSEADSLILQATIGCSFNRCSFCSMYREKEFRVRPLADVFAEIDRIARAAPDVRRVFLADGDAFMLPADHLIALCERLAARFKDLQRVTSYAWPLNLLKKTDAELEAIRAAKLSLVYVGVESGSADLLRRITKGATPAMIAETITRAQAAGIKVSATLILGLGGRERSAEHVRGTAELVNRAAPNYLSTLQLGLDPMIEQEFLTKQKSSFERLDDQEILAELEAMLTAFAPERPVIFRSNHASNALALAGNLPKDKDRLLAEVSAARRNERPLRPHFLRGY